MRFIFLLSILKMLWNNCCIFLSGSLKAGKEIAMKKLLLYSGVALFAVSCASQKYSRTDNIVDDVYFSPSDAPQSVEAEAPDEQEQNGFEYDQSTSTPNTNTGYYSYQPTQNATPDTTTSVNYGATNYQSTTNNYYSGYGNSYNGYMNYGPNHGFAFQQNFGVFYTPTYGFGSGMYGYNRYGYMGGFTPHYSPFGYNCYPSYSFYPSYGYGYYPSYGYGYGYYPGYGNNLGYGYSHGGGGITPGITQGGPRNTGSSIMPSTLYSGGRVKSPVTTTTPEKHIYRPSNRVSTNEPNTPSRGVEGTPGVKPQDGSNGRVAPSNPNTPQAPERREQPRTKAPENKPQPTPQTPQSPRTREPERRPQPTPQAPQTPRTREPERRPQPTPQPSPQRTNPTRTRPSRTPSVNPSPAPSRTPSSPSRSNSNTPQRRR